MVDIVPGWIGKRFGMKRESLTYVFNGDDWNDKADGSKPRGTLLDALEQFYADS